MSSCSMLPWFGCDCVIHFILWLKIPTSVTLCPSIVNVLTKIQNHSCYYPTLFIPYIHLLAYVLIPVTCPCYLSLTLQQLTSHLYTRTIINTHSITLFHYYACVLTQGASKHISKCTCFIYTHTHTHTHTCIHACIYGTSASI